MDVTWLAVVGLWMVMLLTADVADSLACYNCDSTNKICSANEIRGQKILQVNCPNADDECGMAFTIHPATGHRRILNRTCRTTHELRHYDQLRRGGGDRGSVGGLLVRVASNERRGLFELVELRLSHCNRSLCNSRYPDVSNQVATPLECYFCSSVDNPACDFGGIDLKQMNDTVLARCPSVGGPFHCALSYKTRRMSHQPQQPKQQKPRKMDRVVVVSRTCLSDDDLASYKRQLGADLVGVDSADSSVETHLFVCSDVSGCNWRFSDVAAGRATGEGAKKEEEEEVTSCYECNNEGNSSSTCSLESANISQMEENGKRDDKKEREEERWRQGKRRLIRECPVEQSYGCVIWYKVRLETQDVAAVVRSCLSRDDANRYRANYAAAAATSSVADRATTVGPLSPLSEERGSSVEVYWKEDGSQRAIYFLAMCFRSLCNLRFPDFEPVTRLCFVCSQDADDACDATGNRLSSATHLRHCPDPSDLCSLSYVVGLGRTGDQLLRPSAVRRSCISQRRAAEYQRHLSTDDGDLVVISGGSDVTDQSISDIHLFLCWSSKCNRRLPDGLRDSAPAPGLTCYTCSSSSSSSSSQQQHPQQPEDSTANEEDAGVGGDACGAQLTPEEGAAFVSRCAARRGARREEDDEGGVGDDGRQIEEQRCFMSYVLAADGSQSHFNRSCISVAEILSLKRRFGPDLISTDLGPHLQRYMFHCSASLCNRQFPPTASTANKRSPINCFICNDSHASSISSSSSSSSSSASSDCGVDGSELSRSLLLPCSVFERFFCAVVARFNASSPGALLLVSMRRHCISERDAVAYMSKGDRLELGLKDAGDIVVFEERARKAGAAAAGTAGSFKNFLFICRSDGCNAQFPQLKDVVQRHLAETPIGVSGPVINEKNSKKTDDSGDEDLDEQQSPRTGASHSTAQRPILALGGHLTTAVALVIAASALDR